MKVETRILGAALAGVAWLAAGARAAEVPEACVAGFGTIAVEDIERHVAALAGPGLEGRDSPSAGLERAARYIEAQFEEAGLEPAGDDGYRFHFALKLPAPVPEACALSLEVEGRERPFELGADFVPVSYCGGAAAGELVFCGFGIRARKERYDELDGRGLEGAIALVVEGEPRHPVRFAGEELTEHATLWEKLAHLADEDVAGVLVVRRPEPGAEQGALAFRHTWASWSVESMTPVPAGLPRRRPPTLEITAACASELLGADVLELARGLDASARARKPLRSGRRVRLSAETRERELEVDNVVGLLPGRDPALAAEAVVIGAHYDHVGVDDRGRVGHGADDNASGTAALIELAQALARARPARSVLLAAFAAEEDGLIGSAELCRRPPLEPAAMVAMLNMDMIGRGRTDEVAVIGVKHNPDLGQLLRRAGRLQPTGVERTVTGKGQELWARSDHYSFHRIGVPTLFFFEGLPIESNPDYHTWRDTPERLDLEKVARTTRLVFNTAWLLANDEARPAPPRD